MDLVLHTADGDLFVEVTQAMDEHRKQLAAEIRRRRFEYAGRATWDVSVNPDADLGLLEALLPGLLLSIENYGHRPSDSRSLGAVGVEKAYMLPLQYGDGVIVVSPAAESGLDPAGAVRAVEAEVAKADNRAKLRRVGGGDLFVWVDINQRAFFFGASGLSVVTEPLVLAPEVQRAWMAIKLPYAAGDGRHELAALNVQSFTAKSGWLDHGDPMRLASR